MWETALRQLLPRGTVGRSILGDLREQHARRAASDRVAADKWYREEARSVAVYSVRKRLLGGWQAESATWRSGGRDRTMGRGDAMFDEFLRSVSYAIRSLARTPRYTAIAVLTLALGIGANTAVFSVVNGVLLKPLDFRDPDALVNVWSSAPGLGYRSFPLSPHYYFTFRSENSAFSEMGSYSPISATLAGDGDPEDVRATAVTATLFPTLGVEASLGRTFSTDEDLPDSKRVAVISHGLWRRRFGGDREVLGRTLDIDGDPHEIVGVMPRHFDFPGDVELWVPARYDPANAPWNFTSSTVGRLAPGLGATQAQAQLVAIVERIIESYPEGSDWRNFMVNGQYTPLVRSVKEDMVGSLEQPLWILLGTVGFVLLIACTNVTNLVLIRGEARRRESAVRSALGASKTTLARQNLLESTLLAFAGATIGSLVAWIGVPAVLRHAPPQLPRLDEVGVDANVLLFTLGATVVSVLLFGSLPILRIPSADLLTSLKQGGHGSTAGPKRQRSRAVLVVTQTAMALVLMVGSGLLVRSFWRVYRTDLGFRYQNLLTFRITLPQSRYPTPSARTAYHGEVLRLLRALPGVESAALTSVMPVADPSSASPFEVLDSRAEGDDAHPMVEYKYVSHGYVETMGVPLLVGRAFSAADDHGGSGQVMVNQTLVDRFWPGENPIGKQLRLAHQPDRWYSVLGVVGATLEMGVRRESRALVYFPLMSLDGENGWSVSSATYIVGARDPIAVAQSVHSAVWSVDGDIPVASMQTGGEIVAESEVRLSFTAVTLGIAAVVALILGTVGLYGVLSYTVTQRKQEIAVHMALGASQREVMRKVVGDGARLSACGIVAGLAGAWALTRLLRGLLFGVEALDPLTYGAMAVILLSVALVAAFLPARRAAAVDPLESMRVGVE